MWVVSWQGAQDAKRSERPRPVSAGAAARNHAPTYDTKLLILTLDAKATKSQAKVSLEAWRDMEKLAPRPRSACVFGEVAQVTGLQAGAAAGLLQHGRVADASPAPERFRRHHDRLAHADIAVAPR